MGVGGRGHQEIPAVGRQREQTAVDEVVKGIRHGKRLAGLDRDVGALEHPDDLERIEGIPAGRLVHLRQQRTRQCDAEVFLDELVQRRRLERRRPDRVTARGERSEAHRLARSRPRSDMRAAGPTCSDSSRRAAYASAPAEAASSHCTSSTATSTSRVVASPRKRVEHSDPDRVRVRRRAFDLLEHERARECRALCRRAAAPAPPSSTGSRRSPSPENESAVSLSAGCASRTQSPPLSAVSTPTRQSVVFPIPASPSRTSADAPSETPARKALRTASSASRPTTAAGMAGRSYACAILRVMAFTIFARRARVGRRATTGADARSRGSRTR